LLEFVPGHVWNSKDAEWEEMYQAYKEFKEKYVRDPSRSLNIAMDAFELSLARWLSTQRSAYNKDPKEISQERIDKLNSIPGHVWNSNDAEWEKMYQAYKEFKEKYGRDPSRSLNIAMDAFELSLAEWLSTQRLVYNKDPKEISQERIDNLNLVPGHVWEVRPMNTNKQEKNKKTLKESSSDILETTSDGEMGTENGLTAPKSAKITKVVGGLVFYQDDIYPDKWKREGDPYNTLYTFEETPQGSTILTVDGFSYEDLLKTGVPSLVKASSWWNTYQKYNAFKEMNKRDPGSRSDDKYESALFNWLKSQRNEYKHKRINKVKRLLLELVPGHVWNSNDAEWGEMYQAYKEFKEKYGRDPSRSRFLNIAMDAFELSLAHWLSTQRSAYNKDPKEISQERIDNLNLVPGHVWNSKDAEWEKMYQAYKEFKEKYGRDPSRSLNVAMDAFELSLARWLATQRSVYNKDPKEISQERIDNLNLVPGHVWGVKLQTAEVDTPIQKQENIIKETLSYKKAIEKADEIILKNEIKEEELSLLFTSENNLLYYFLEQGSDKLAEYNLFKLKILLDNSKSFIFGSKYNDLYDEFITSYERYTEFRGYSGYKPNDSALDSKIMSFLRARLYDKTFKKTYETWLAQLPLSVGSLQNPITFFQILVDNGLLRWLANDVDNPSRYKQIKYLVDLALEIKQIRPSILMSYQEIELNKYKAIAKENIQ